MTDRPISEQTHEVTPQGQSTAGRSGGARQRAREEVMADIRSLALDQLAERGAGELSMRKISRDLGVVSSALFRYYPSRDALITALITEAYHDLAAVLQDSLAPAAPPARQWVNAVEALHRWAVAEPHRFHLIYGSPVPGYQAPEDTIAPATAVMITLLRVAAGGGGGEPAAEAAGLDPESSLFHQAAHAAEQLGFEVSPEQLIAAAGAWAETLGLVALELGGHFVSGFEPAEELFSFRARQVAHNLGLSHS